ncbi:hypothetical protein VMUT_1075 [Vulcanisaeta moutnovskia 768-28]|uniref:Uncharacterized protein n=1 Tax=Vulcanisaeta moutnovskia (strain 768-28) TaxID=985053 RepID=F0QXW8_VULM7|nr:hypothetical protein [Vulcanisaeta moutnovskia]ADY01281.1 hypothetical protein VMUT_1075 [Vulcanisaeta moutnovskia 768-28]
MLFLRSRGLFKNWFWAGVRYMLIRHGLAKGDVDVTFRCGVGARLSPSAYSWLVNAYRNGLIGRVDYVGGAYLYGVVRFSLMVMAIYYS